MDFNAETQRTRRKRREDRYEWGAEGGQAVRGATRPVTIRMPVADVEVAQEIAERRGVPYQTYIKGLLHKALERERKAS